MAQLKKSAGKLQATGTDRIIRLSWSHLEGGCLIRAVLLSLSGEELGLNSGGVAPVKIESPKPCTSELLIGAWTTLKCRIADKSSELFLSLSEAFDDMEEKLQYL